MQGPGLERCTACAHWQPRAVLETRALRSTSGNIRYACRPVDAAHDWGDAAALTVHALRPTQCVLGQRHVPTSSEIFLFSRLMKNLSNFESLYVVSSAKGFATGSVSGSRSAQARQLTAERLAAACLSGERAEGVHERDLLHRICTMVVASRFEASAQTVYLSCATRCSHDKSGLQTPRITERRANCSRNVHTECPAVIKGRPLRARSQNIRPRRLVTHDQSEPTISGCR